MTDSDNPNKKTGGIERAPWDPPAKPASPYPHPPGNAPQGPPQGSPQPPQGAPPQPQQGYPPPQPGGANFAEPEAGRGRTRSIPKQEVSKGTAPLGNPQGGYIGQPGPNAPPAPQPGPGAPQAPGPGTPQGYSQDGAPPQGYPPAQPAGAPAYGAQPYGGQAYPVSKPTTVMGIISLVLIGVGLVTGLGSVGIFSAPLFLVGAILGFLAMRETAPGGKKTGRGMAVGGTVANLVLLVLNVAGLIAVFMFIRTTAGELEAGVHARTDGALLVERVQLYHEHKGDLEPGGPQVKLGFAHDVAVEGRLKADDLASPSELNNPAAQYSIDIVDGIATIYWTPPGGARQEVGSFNSNRSGFESSRRPGFHD